MNLNFSSSSLLPPIRMQFIFLSLIYFSPERFDLISSQKNSLQIKIYFFYNQMIGSNLIKKFQHTLRGKTEGAIWNLVAIFWELICIFFNAITWSLNIGYRLGLLQSVSIVHIFVSEMRNARIFALSMAWIAREANCLSIISIISFHKFLLIKWTHERERHWSRGNAWSSQWVRVRIDIKR